MLLGRPFDHRVPPESDYARFLQPRLTGQSVNGGRSKAAPIAIARYLERGSGPMDRPMVQVV